METSKKCLQISSLKYSYNIMKQYKSCKGGQNENSNFLYPIKISILTNSYSLRKLVKNNNFIIHLCCCFEKLFFSFKNI